MADNINSKLIIKDKIKSKSNLHCCVPLCTSDSRYNADLHFHHIPKNPDLKKQWIIKIRRDEGPLFNDDYKSWNPVRMRLKPNAVFNWVQEKTPRRALKRKIISTETSKTEESINDGVKIVPDEAIGQDGTECCDEIDEKAEKIKELEERLKQKTEECDSLKQQLSLEKIWSEYVFF